MNINSIKMKTVGAVVFIHLLLLIAGVEPNPGPSDALVFRYMYLLIEVGTHLLRKLFNNKVSNDFMQYLKTNNKAAKQLQFLLGSDVITDHQKKFLPPLDNSPNTENFDITLLVCFLRNICGLKQYKDPVWKCPASRDRTVEAEITRFRECRNLVVHTGTLYISESDLKQKLSELCQILHRLNYYCGATNLSEMIEDANSKPLDDQLKQKYDNILKAWHEAESLFEKGIDQLKIGQSEIKQTQSKLKSGQSEIIQTQSDLKEGQYEIKQTQSELKSGQSEIKQTQSELKSGQSEIKQTQSELKSGQSEIKQTQSELKDGQSEIKQTQSALKDGQYEIKHSQSELKDGQSEIIHTQSELKSGQSEIKHSQSELKDGQSEIIQTQSELKDGQSETKHSQSELKDGQSEIIQTQSELKDGQSEIKHSQSELKDGQSEIIHSQSELKDGQSQIIHTQSELREGQSEIKHSQSELKSGQSEIKNTQSELKDGQSEIKQTQTKLLKSVQDLQQQTKRRLDDSEQPCNTTKGIKSFTNDDIQKILIDAYQSDICSSLPLYPLLDDETEDTLKMYQMPTMYVVNYHKVEKQQTDKSSDNLEKVKTCSDLFHVKDKDCKNIYLTGDAGVGKTSFCKFLSLLWCKSKLGKKLEKVDMQEYIDYLVRFEFVFYVNLRDTHFTDLKAIVVNQLFYSENKDYSNRMYDIVEEILGNHDSLVIMDGLDEWAPKPTDKQMYVIPVRPKSLKCVYLTTCRPYKIENVRLPETKLDHQVKMTGLGETEIESYVCNLINIINTKHDENKNKKEFMMAVKQANLLDMLHIPMTTSHLVMLWFDRPLTSMSKSLIYGNIMDMLFKLADKKGIVIQQSKPSKLKLPDRLSELKHFKDHFSQIEQLCLLSFKLLFEHDTDITSLVFTRDQLASEPYCLSEEETNLFCTIGILSKNKVKRTFGKQEHKLSFLHKSSLEFFAAIYVSTLDTSEVLELFSQCRTTNDVLKYKSFLIFYAGLSIEKFVSLMTRIYSLISKDLDLTRVLSIFSTLNDTREKMVQLLFLQDLILKCNIEGSYQIKYTLPLEDFIFDEFFITDSETKYLRKLILSNLNNVRLLRSDTGEYFDQYDNITSLKGLDIQKCDNKCLREFSELIKQNKSSLHIISIAGKFDTPLSLPLEDLQYLTSLSLTIIKMSHEDIQYLTKFLSKNSQLKHVRLKHVECTEHRMYNGVCGSFELVQCNKLVYLHIECYKIVCTNIVTSSLEYLKLCTNTKSIAMSIFNSIQYALKLKYLNIWVSACYKLDGYLVETLITNVQYLSKIESIDLRNFTIRDNVSFLLHPSVQQVSIRLWDVSMTAKWFHTFIESVIDKHCCIKLYLSSCIIKQDNGNTKGRMSKKESVVDIHDYIKSKSAIKIVRYDRSTWYCIEFVINDNQ